MTFSQLLTVTKGNDRSGEEGLWAALIQQMELMASWFCWPSDR